MLKLQGYDFEAEYISLQNNISDRNPTNDTEVEMNALDTQVNQTISYAIPIPLTIDDNYQPSFKNNEKRTLV